MLTRVEITVLLKMVRDRLLDLALGLHRFWLNRHNKSLSESEMLPMMKDEVSMLTRIRNKLWRMKRDGK